MIADVSYSCAMWPIPSRHGATVGSDPNAIMTSNFHRFLQNLRGRGRWIKRGIKWRPKKISASLTAIGHALISGVMSMRVIAFNFQSSGNAVELSVECNTDKQIRFN